MRLFIITGISGSGKTTVARALVEAGEIALDSKLTPGLFHFIDAMGNVPDSNNPNDPAWKARHKWVINLETFRAHTAQLGPLQKVYLCGGGDSLHAMWPQAEKVLFLQLDAPTLIKRLNNPSRDNQFANNDRTQEVLLNRLDAYQANQRARGAIAIDATAPLSEVMKTIQAVTQ